MARRLAKGEKPLFWIGSSKRDLLEFPEAAKDRIGTALSAAQFGGRYRTVKPWKGEGTGVFEVVENRDGNTYRTVYTVRFERAVYVLHAFQKKSPTGIKTARPDVDLISRRLKVAQEDYQERYGASQDYTERRGHPELR
jgi:phage-related protein